MEGARRCLRSRDGVLRGQRARAPPGRRVGRRAAAQPVRREVLVLRELPDGAEPVQRRQHARDQLGHRLLGRPGLRGRLRRLPHLRRLQAGAEARLGHALLRAAGRPVGVGPRRRRRRRHARAVGRQRAGRLAVRRRARRQERRHGRPIRTARGRACGSSTSAIRRRRPRSRPSTRTAARTPTRCCPSPDGKSMRVLNSSYPLGDGPTCGPLGEAQGRKVNHGVVQVIDVPFDDPAQASELTELPVVYPGDADGTYKPGLRARHRRAAGRLPRLPRPELVPEEGHRGRGLRRAGADLEHRRGDRPARHGEPGLGLRPDERRLLALRHLQLGRRGRQLHRRVLRRRLPDGDDEDRRPARRHPPVQHRQHVLLRHEERRPAVGVPQPAAVERPARARGRRPAARTAPRTSASRCRRATATCWSTRSTAAARR